MMSVALPDVAASSARVLTGPINRVGMARIAAPIRIGDQRVAASIDVSVNLIDPNARGIHMSRLYAIVASIDARGPLTPNALRAVLTELLDSHRDLSNGVELRLRGALLIERPALVSGLPGWREYPFEIRAEQDLNGARLALEVVVTYSSTCPSSAALARQSQARAFRERFADAADVSAIEQWLAADSGHATAHAQRSFARVAVTLKADATELPSIALINTVEIALATPVQAAVKRVDEQAFAERNGANLMFCEDAARRLSAALTAFPAESFAATVEHIESLHAHDAVARISGRCA
jgi:GTP cyclohydrolase IB